MCSATTHGARGDSDTPGQLEVAAHGVTAILATWLGLTVVSRVRNRRGAVVFALLCAYLLVWSLAVIVQRLTSEPAVLKPLNALENVAAYMLPVGTLHIALALSVEGRHSTAQRLVLGAAYAISIAMAAGAVFFPDQKFNVSAPHFEMSGIRGEVFGWAWIAARVLLFGVAIGWISAALRRAEGDAARRRSMLAALATVCVGATGGVLRIVPVTADTQPWIGVSLVMVGLVLAAYAVFGAGVLLARGAAERAFRYSLIGGLVITAYVALLIGTELVTQRFLGIDLPIVTALAIVVTIALFEPISERLGGIARGPTGDAASDRLLRALGKDILTAQRPERAIGPSLARVSRTFGLRGAMVLDRDGQTLATNGIVPDIASSVLRLALHADGVDFGSVILGPKRNGLPLTEREVDLLRLASGYMAASMRFGERHEQEASALSELRVELAAIESRGSLLSRALVAAGDRSEEGLHVFALGPLRAERGGSPIQHWGGPKAGARQAEALFAFLYDRGERGVSKDEIIELIWPDTDLERADIAFHRTLGGLRSTLEPGRRGYDRGAAVAFINDRYRLDPRVVEWSDVQAFEDGLAAAGAVEHPADAVAQLERARSLYRGDYLDDCPFYGDSTFVEERRELLRGRMVDLLLSLGQRYAERGDRPGAASCFRQASAVAREELPAATGALARLDSPS
jgi:DNA-binding SARP family transcriptional activator